MSAFAVGRRWSVIREDKPSFDFVILGPGEYPGYKRCRIDVDPLWWRRRGHVGDLAPLMTLSGEGARPSYTREQLRKRAVSVPADDWSLVERHRAAESSQDYRALLFCLPEAVSHAPEELEQLYRQARTKAMDPPHALRDRYAELHFAFLRLLQARA